jgi:hypothetical protein
MECKQSWNSPKYNKGCQMGYNKKIKNIMVPRTVSSGKKARHTLKSKFQLLFKIQKKIKK